METNAYVFCDWTLLDLVARFCVFFAWGYLRGKNITTSPNRTWALTFTGVVLCAFLHMWIHFCDLSQSYFYEDTGYTEEFEAARKELMAYGLKIFLFYFMASVVGFSKGRQKAAEIIEELDRVNAALKKWEAQGLIEKEDTNDPPEDGRASVIQPPAWLRNNAIFKKWHRKGIRK